MTKKRDTTPEPKLDSPPEQPPEQTSPPAPTPPPARVHKAGDWYLVTHGSWQISVAPDGLLMLPRHLHPDEVEDFARCALVAKDIGTGILNDNAKKTAVAPAPVLSTRQAIVHQGPPPAGAARMRVTSAQQRAAAVGREKRGSGVRATPERPTRGV